MASFLGARAAFPDRLHYGIQLSSMPNAEPEHPLLAPNFEKAYWRSQERRRYREQSGFSKKKGHFEPEDHNPYAARWAEELVREQTAEEIRQIYENAVVILGNRRSQMERSELSLDCAQFRYAIQASQYPGDPAYLLLRRLLWIKIPLDTLPAHFDDLFPYKASELVVPFTGKSSPKEILEVLEGWEEKLSGKLSESAAQSSCRLDLPNGFGMEVDLLESETVFSFRNREGVLGLGLAVAEALKSLKISKPLL